MIRYSLLCIALVTLLGCRNAPASNQEVASALDVLKSGLDAWKDGSPPASLKSGANPIEFSDSDWQAGAKLLEYRILKAGAEEDGETVCTVLLKVEVRGKAMDRRVNYRVLLNPKRVVSRAPNG